jgi:hypothetical protein
MAFRMVSSADAKSAADAKAFIVSDTGGMCIPTGLVREVSNGFQVEVFSTDGRGHMPLAAGRQLFRVDAISRCGGFARLKDDHGITYDAPRKIGGFGAQYLGMAEVVTLEVGLMISAVIVGNDFTEVMIEEGEGAAIERPAVESVGPNPVAHKIDEAKQNYEKFMKQFKDGATDDPPPKIVTESKIESEKDRNAFMNRLLNDLRPRE